MRITALVLALVLPLSALASRPAKRFYNSHDYYVLEHDPSADASLDECAQSLGVEIVEQAGELRNHWLVRTAKPALSERIYAKYGKDYISNKYPDKKGIRKQRTDHRRKC